MNFDKPTLSEQHIRQIIITLMAFVPIIGMAVDLIAPSLPAIASTLNIPPSLAKNVISLYLLGYALGNFITGFLTDAFGRRNLLRIALLGFIVASLLPVGFAQMSILLVARLLQGLMMGSVAVLMRAILADILPSEKLVRLGTVLGTMWGLGPVVGPVIGGYLQFYFGYKAGFCFFALASVAAFIAIVIIVPETIQSRHPLQVAVIKKNLLEILKHRLFMGMVILMGLVYSLMISFHTLGPFLIQNRLHYSPVGFGHLALGLGLAYLAATFLCRRLLKTQAVEKLYYVLIHTFFVLALLGLMLSCWWPMNLALIACISAVMFFACGFIFPLSMGKGMSLFRHIAGTAAAMMYLINVLITSFTAFLLSFVSAENAIVLMAVYFTLLLGAVLVFWTLCYSRPVLSPNQAG